MHTPEPAIFVFDTPPVLDPRMYAAAFLEPTPDTAKGSKIATASTTVKIEGKEHLFAVPSHAALCLNLSQKAFEKIKEIELSHAFKDTSYGYVSEEKLSLLYELFEQVISNTVFACTAIEAFCNQVIPDDYVYTKKRQDKKCTETYNKDQIERFINLDEKLSTVLPEVTQCNFRKGSSLWNDYHNLRKIRDRIIHVKSTDLGVKESKEKNIWEELLKRKNIDCSIIAHKIISIFKVEVDPSESPVASGRNRWIDHFPFKHS
jgi:hypothetical protein